MRSAIVLGLRGRVLLLLFAAFVSFTLFVAWNFVSHRDERIDTAKAELLAHVKLIAARQHAILAQAGGLLTDLLIRPDLGPGALPDDCSRILAQELKQHRAFLNMGMALPNGDATCSAIPVQGIVNVADRLYFQEALKTQEMVIGEVVSGRAVGKPVITFAKAMSDRHGHALSVFFVSLSLEWLQHEFAKAQLPNGAHLGVVDGRGAIVVNYPDPETWNGKSAARTPLVQRILASGAEGTLRETGLDGSEQLVAYTPLLESASHTKYYLWLSLSKQVVEAPAQRAALIELGTMTALLICTLAVVIWGGNRMLLQPLLTLSKAAARFGAGDLGARSGLPHGEDEIGRLARTLDETAATIEDRERRLARANRALRVLSAGNRTLLRAASENKLLNEMCRAVVEAGGFRIAWVGYAEHDSERGVRAVAVWGAEPDFLDGLRITWNETELGRGPTGTAIRRCLPVVSNHVATDPDYAPWRERARRYGYGSCLALPLRIDNVAIGALCICAAESGAFDEDVVKILSETGDDLAFGIVTLRTQAERDRVVHENAHHAEALEKSLEQTIQVIADTLEARDPYTAGHQRRVDMLAVAIARELGLAEEKIHGIHLAAAIHDLGKIRVPAEILAKPGKLTDIEFSLIKEHPRAGYDILKDVSFPWPIADIVHQHHERLNGSGYPQGLSDGQIVLEARIVAVADVMEAMSSHRPYRPALGIQPALQEIARGRGSVYDLAVVDACLKLFREKGFTFEA